MDKRDELLLQIKNELVELRQSPLYKFRLANKSFPVIGEGSHQAAIMFVGEAPGKNEAATGRPFCGASGNVLTKMIEHVGMKREDVYITNIVKDRPPDNRDPSPEEIELYSPFLDRQIDILQPKVIATLGRYSMAYIMNKFGLAGELFDTAQSKLKTISQIHGKMFGAKTSYGEIKIITLYHPAVALYNRGMREQLFKDFEIVKSFV